MASLLTATVGVSVQQMYCYCAGKTTFSFFHEAVDACVAQTDQARDACCKIDPPPCCRDEAGTADAHGCTKESVQYFQLKAEYLVAQPLDKSFDFPVWADEYPAYLRLFRPVMCEACQPHKAVPDGPPPLPGRVICVRHAVFRC